MGVAEVAGAEAGDSLPVDVLGVDVGVEGQAGQDGHLVGGIHALDVVGRVGLGVAQLLGATERRPEVGSLAAHAGQDVVGGAVDDGAYGYEFVGQEIAPQRRDDGDAAAYAGLVT